MTTPTEVSPLNLMQEHLWTEEDGWVLLVCCIMLNLTSSVQVWPIVPAFFRRFPGPAELGEADEAEVSSYIRTLGLQNRRARSLVQMSREFPAFDRRGDVTTLPGVGRYAADSWHIFVHPRLIKEDVEDKELRKYVTWAKGRESGRPQVYDEADRD